MSGTAVSPTEIVASTVSSQQSSNTLLTSPVPSVSGTAVSPASSATTSLTMSGTANQNAAGDGTTPQDSSGAQVGGDTNSSDPPTANGGLSTGAIAGISIGCAVAGILLGFLGAWLLFKRRRQRVRRFGSHRSSMRRRRTSTAMNDMEPKYAGTTFDSGGSGIQLALFLLDATPDAEMAAEVRSLGQLIQQHVEGSYHSEKVQVRQHDLAQAAANLGLDQGGSLSADVVASLALDTRTRQVALQHVLSFVLFSSIDFMARSQLSMLPAPIAAFLQSVPPNERGQANGEAAALGLSRWRALSAFLLHPTRSDRTTLRPSESAMMPQAAGLASALDTFLGPFVLSDEESRLQQKEHLEEMIVEVARFGYVLLSQPGDLQFVHVQGRKSADMMAVVCAGLDKVTTRDGTPLDRPRAVLAPMLVQV